MLDWGTINYVGYRGMKSQEAKQCLENHRKNISTDVNKKRKRYSRIDSRLVREIF